MTSNLGTEFVTQSGTLGFLRSGEGGEESEAKEKIEKALKDTFRPEFLNRIDEIIIFSPLSVDQMGEIVDLKMEQVRERLNEHGLEVEISDSARTWLAKEGYDPAFGARPLQRALQKYIESPLSVKILRGDFGDGDTIIVDFLEDEGLVFRRPEQGTPISIEEEVSA
jgi:ATP-dependent Clp protease ATP-binding subunit ClpC